MTSGQSKQIRKAKLDALAAPGLTASWYWFCSRCKTRYAGLYETNPGGDCPMCGTILLDVSTPSDGKTSIVGRPAGKAESEEAGLRSGAHVLEGWQSGSMRPTANRVRADQPVAGSNPAPSVGAPSSGDEVAWVPGSGPVSVTLAPHAHWMLGGTRRTGGGAP